MNNELSLTWEDLHQLFSVVMQLDESLAIVHASPTLKKYVEGLDKARPLSDIFEIERPIGIQTFEDALSNLDSLYLLISRDRQFAVRGQLQRIHIEGVQALCFCGAPWLRWIDEYQPDTRLNLQDFSIQDVQLDQLFFMSTERQMVNDLERLNEDLKLAREEAETAQETKTRTFARMSHEMRTPLNAVVSALGLLKDQELSSEGSELVSMARNASNHLIHVINYVLDMSKLDAIDGATESTEFEQRELLDFVVELIESRATEKSLTINVEIDPNLSPAYLGDVLRLRQTLLNIAINAVKFTNTGGVTLRALLVEKSDRQHRVRFEVIDTGIGIPADMQDKVFQPFWSANEYQQRASEQGTGLGLDIARSNVEVMGGTIGLQSRPGEGSTFWVEVSLSPSATGENTESRKKRADQVPAPDQLRGNVLLVDDNEANLLLGGMILESLGITVSKATGGTAAVAAAHQNKFDLVLMDLNMPDMDGVEATHQIRKFADMGTLPVIALTAYAETREKNQCLQAGMNAYLTKPILREELAKELSRWLSGTGDHESCKTSLNAPAVNSGHTTRNELISKPVLTDLLNQIGPENLEVVLDMFRSESSLQWSQLEAALAEGDAILTRRILHTLSSTFRSLGLLAAGDAFAAIESQYRSEEQPDPAWMSAMILLKDQSLAVFEQTTSKL